MNRLDKDLLDRFLNKTATKEEEKEFLYRLDEGEFNDLIEDDMLEIIRDRRAIPSDAQKAWLDKIHKQILANNNITTPVVPVQRRNRSFLLAAAASVIVLTVAGLWMTTRDNFTTNTSQQQEEIKPSVFSGKQLVKLPDGSTALLNEGSELKFTQSFGVSNREVSLTGEALFDVTHDPAKPFIVRTGKVSTTVLGTSFNVNSSQTKVTVTVVRGLVRVEDDERIYGRINPDEQIEVDIASNDFVVRNAKAEEVLTWQKDFFILDNITFEEAAQAIEERFKVSVSIENEKLKNCKINAWFSHGENLQQIVEAITSTREATVAIKENNVIISGGIGCGEIN
jgi:ferric-dicitrate binding protein FerR (iron transport regulator)